MRSLIPKQVEAVACWPCAQHDTNASLLNIQIPKWYSLLISQVEYPAKGRLYWANTKPLGDFQNKIIFSEQSWIHKTCRIRGVCNNIFLNFYSVSLTGSQLCCFKFWNGTELSFSTDCDFELCLGVIVWSLFRKVVFFFSEMWFQKRSLLSQKVKAVQTTPNFRCSLHLFPIFLLFYV